MTTCSVAAHCSRACLRAFAGAWLLRKSASRAAAWLTRSHLNSCLCSWSSSLARMWNTSLKASVGLCHVLAGSLLDPYTFANNNMTAAVTDELENKHRNFATCEVLPGLCARAPDLQHRVDCTQLHAAGRHFHSPRSSAGAARLGTTSRLNEPHVACDLQEP